MNNLNIPVDKVVCYSKYKIIYSNGEKYLVKKKNDKHSENINYLKKINCHNYLPIYKCVDLSEVYLFRDDIVNDNEKIKYLILTLVDIHKNSLEIYDYEKEEVDSFYNRKVKEIDSMMKYYLSFQDYIEEMDDISEDYLELLINMSKIYRILSLSRKYLEEWYCSDKKYSEVFLVGNLSLNNFIYSDKGYFIDLSNSSRGNIIDDLVNIYRNNYSRNINNLIDLYDENIQLKESDMKLFFSKISRVEKLKFTKNSSINLKIVKEFIEYIDNTIQFILEKDKKYQETDKEIFEKENKDIEFGSYEK